MFLIGPDDIERLLVAGGPGEWLAGVKYPLHVALREFVDGVGTPTLPGGAQVRLVPDPECGLAVEGVEGALVTLAESGVIRLSGQGLSLVWTVDSSRLDRARTSLMRLAADDAAAVYRVGRKWAALAATSSKTWRAAS